MAATPTLEENEVLIDATRFRVAGPVRTTNISVTPNPVIFGDTSRQGETQVLSQFIQSSAVGGQGTYKGNPRTDTDVYWISDLETRYRDLLCLPPLVTQMSSNPNVGTDLAATIDFDNVQWFAFGNLLYTWNNTSSVWSSLQQTLVSTCTDLIVFKGQLYAAYGTNYDYYDGLTWTTCSPAQPASFFTVWDSKLWTLGYSGSPAAWTAFSSTDGLTWTTKAALPRGITVSQMLVYRDSEGLTVIYALTDTGPWAYDATNDRWLQTEVQFPRMRTSEYSRGVVFKDGRMYLNNGGLSVLALQSGNPFVVSPIGLDLKDGVPAEHDGIITDLSTDFNFVLCLITGTQTGTAGNVAHTGMPYSWPLGGTGFANNSGRSELKALSNGWHTLYASGAIYGTAKCVRASSAYDTRRVYFGMDRQVFYIEVSTSIHNPRHNPARTFQQGPLEHVTPWFDYGTSAQRKIHGHFFIRTTGCSSTETVKVYYSTDLDDVTWTQLGTTITSDGETELRVEDRGGTEFRFVRYKIVLERGSDNSLSPFVEYWSADFMRVLPATYAFAFDIDISENYGGRTPDQQRTQLLTLADPASTPGFIKFAYKDDSTGLPQTFYGKISRISGQEFTGLPARGEGRWMVSFVAPYSEDTE